MDISIYVYGFFLSEEPLSRPSMDEVAKRLETFYVGMCLSEVNADLIQRQDQLDQLQKEDADYGSRKSVAVAVIVELIANSIYY